MSLTRSTARNPPDRTGQPLPNAGEVVVERPRGSRHPRWEESVYPLDYGYLTNTRGTDGAEIDVWLGSLSARQVTAIVATVDPLKGDMEIKLLVGCTEAEAMQALAMHNRGEQAGVLVRRPTSHAKAPESR